MSLAVVYKPPTRVEPSVPISRKKHFKTVLTYDLSLRCGKNGKNVKIVCISASYYSWRFCLAYANYNV